MPLTNLRSILAQMAAPSSPFDRFRTPGYNPNAEDERYGQDPYDNQVQSDDTYTLNAPSQDRFADLTRGLQQVLGPDRGDKLDEVYGQYLEQIGNKPKQSAWRTAAAIGTSFLRPLREGGVPQMLATSPAEQEWESKMSLLGSRLKTEAALAQEGMKQRGDVAKNYAQYGVAALTPKVVSGGGYDPFTREKWQNVPKGGVLAQSEFDGRMRPVIENREPTSVPAMGMVILPDGTVTYGPKSVVGDNVVGGPDAPTLAPSAKERTSREMAVQDLRNKGTQAVANTNKASALGVADISRSSAQGVANTNAASRNQVALTQADAARDVAGTHAGAAVDAATIRATAPTRSGVNPQGVATTAFQARAAQLGRQLRLDEIDDPQQLQDALGQLQNIFEAQRQSLGTKGVQVASPDFQAIFDQAVGPDGWDMFDWQPDVRRDKVQSVYDEAVRAGMEKLSGVGPATAEIPITSYVSRAEFDAEAAADGVSPGTPEYQKMEQDLRSNGVGIQ